MGRARGPRHATIPGEIRRRRKLFNWNQQELADNAGLSLACVAAAEQGHDEPTQQVLTSIAAALGCTWQELVQPACLVPHGLEFTTLFPRFLAWEQAASASGPDVGRLEVDTIAIDLSDGSTFIQNTVVKTTSLSLHFRILMLEVDSTKLRFTDEDEAPEREQTETWSRLAAIVVEDVRTRFRENGWGDPNKSVTVEIRAYPVVPTLHGVRATRNGEVRLAVTRCRRLAGCPPLYDWHREGYEYLRPGDEAFVDRNAEWESRWCELWDMSREDFVYS